MVRAGVQGPHGAGSATMVPVFHFLRGFHSNAVFPGCSLRFPERSVHTERGRGDAPERVVTACFTLARMDPCSPALNLHKLTYYGDI